ncbi:putative RNA-directed DNA polymerase, partial [Tanacetum coccineum]
MWNNSQFDFSVKKPDGKSGGIVAIWDISYFTLSDTLSGDGFLALIGRWRNVNIPCIFVVVYAPQEQRLKKELWLKLSRLILNNNTLTIVLGDFNEVRSQTECLGTIFDPRGALNFNEFISTTGLHDLLMGAKRFTRMNNLGNKLSKIDRILVSQHAIDKWPNSNIIALPREFWDHTPILLSSSATDFGPTPFKLFNSWLLNPDFFTIVQTCWANMLIDQIYLGVYFKLKLQRLKADLKQWHAKVTKTEMFAFTDIRNKIDQIDIKAESQPFSSDEVSSRISLVKSLATIEHVRLKDLKQKAKIRWAMDGDENSRFFHRMIKNRSNKSRLYGLNIHGVWVTDPSTLHNHIFQSFHMRFKESGHSRPTYSSSLFNQLSVDEVQLLVTSFFDVEIKDAVWDCGSDKAPGPDGFTFKFLKKHWNLLEYDIIAYVKDFEATAYIPKGCNSSFITLVPKVEDPIVIVIASVVSEVQIAFVKGRQIIDGPLIVDEIIAWAKKPKNDSLLMAPQQKNSSLIGVFDKETPSLLSSLSLRLKPLMSPLLESTNNNIFHGIKVGKDKVHISHLQFADDSLIMGEWSLSNSKNLSRILTCFHLASGLRVNFKKSKLFGIGVTNLELNTIASSIGFLASQFPCIYLGLPIGAKMTSCSNWNPLVERFLKRLFIWKAKTLSFGGRITLIRSVLGSLGVYYFSTFKAPKKIICKLEGIRRRFFWGGSANEKKISWIAWDKVTSLRNMGGIGIGSLKASNQSLLAKWWRIPNEEHALWSKVICSLHGPMGGLVEDSGSVIATTGPWSQIRKLKIHLNTIGINLPLLFKKKVGNGRNTSFWHDKWL